MLAPLLAWAQGGRYTYAFLDLPAGSRNAALGGYGIAIYDNDLSLAFDNPAHLSEKTHNVLMANYQNWFGNINLASVAYSRNVDEKNYLSYGMRYVDYGKFQGTTTTDQPTGNFTAKDMVANVSYGRWISPSWSAGVSAKIVYSVYEKYQSVGMAFDLGFSYHNKDKNLTVVLVLKDIGFQFKGYHSVEGKQRYEMLPVNLMTGLSYRLPMAPLRFSFTYHNMQTWDLSYSSSEASLDVMSSKSKAARGADMFFRHTIWSVEVLPTDYLYFIIAYNHRNHRDMALASKRSVAGFSFGAGFTVKQFSVGFSLVPYRAGNIGYNVNFAVNLAEFGIK